MTHELALLVLTAGGIGFFHTLLGPDHYLPFIVLSRARGWSRRKTAGVTLLCGIGHVLSSVLLGMVGIATGVAVGHLEAVESWRGNLAAWALITVGLVYGAWGLHRALRRKGHSHFHFPGTRRMHELQHLSQHHPERLAEAEASGRVQLTPWVLFIVFALGPCEPLIPILMYPAAAASWGGVALVAARLLAGHPDRHAGRRVARPPRPRPRPPRPPRTLQPRPRRPRHLLERRGDPAARAVGKVREPL